jgi:hypothetical protein
MNAIPAWRHIIYPEPVRFAQTTQKDIEYAIDGETIRPMIHECPHCHENCMSSLQKLFVGPMNSVSCKSCGKAVSISRWPFLFLLALVVLLLFLVRLLEFEPLPIILTGLIAVPVIAAMQLKLVPLLKDQIKDGF